MDEEPEVDEPSEVEPDEDTDDEEVQEPEGPEGFEPWQRDFALTADKTVRDYLMLLPREQLECEGVPSAEFDEEARTERIKKLADDYILLDVEGMARQLKVFPRDDGDVVVTVLNCGAGCMCNHTAFSTWTDDGWAEVEVFDSDRVDKYIHKKKGPDTLWWLALPEEGTDALIVGEGGKKFGTMAWEGGHFKPQK
jgi:hypothetical protein